MADACSAIVLFYFLNLMKTDKIFILALIAAVSLAVGAAGSIAVRRPFAVQMTVAGNDGFGRQ